MKIQYKKLLNLELWHDYVLGAGNDLKELPLDYSIAEYLSLSPTQSCQKLMSQLNWVFRPSPWGGIVFSKVEKLGDDFQTTIPVEDSYRLTFWLLMKDYSLANFSNISLDVPQKNLYYFSNLSNNKDSDLFYLSQPLSPYQLGQEYELGDLVVDNDKILESTQYQEFSSVIPEEGFWQTLTGTKAQYTSKKDLVNKQSSQGKFIIKNVSPGDELQIILKDENQQIVFSLEKTVPNVHQRGKDFLLDLDLSNQKPGCYQLLINEEVMDRFILVDSFAPGNKLGLVEIIINEKLENENFKFLRKKLDTGQTVISPKSYIIRFKNRATRWRYNYDKAQNLTDFNREDFDISENRKKIATKKAINLYHLSKIKVESLPKLKNNMLLPVPKVTFISPEFESGRLANIFSDIYL